jgi:hypothetical protein
LELFAQIRRDELLDKAIGFGKLPVREMADLLNIAPQLLYYRIRTRKLTKQVCNCCGTLGFIDLEEACEEFPALAEAVQEEKEALGIDVDTEPT